MGGTAPPFQVIKAPRKDQERHEVGGGIDRGKSHLGHRLDLLFEKKK